MYKIICIIPVYLKYLKESMWILVGSDGDICCMINLREVTDGVRVQESDCVRLL